MFYQIYNSILLSLIAHNPQYNYIPRYYNIMVHWCIVAAAAIVVYASFSDEFAQDLNNRNRNDRHNTSLSRYIIDVCRCNRLYSIWDTLHKTTNNNIIRSGWSIVDFYDSSRPTAGTCWLSRYRIDGRGFYRERTPRISIPVRTRRRLI